MESFIFQLTSDNILSSTVEHILANVDHEEGT